MNNSRHILIVDDQPEFREIFGAELKAQGYGIFTASGGAEAIEIAKEHHPDLILMDVQMPGMTGVETILKLKEDESTKNIKVVFLTNLGNNDAESELVNGLAAQDIRAEGYMKKTEDMSSFLDQIKNYLGQQ